MVNDLTTFGLEDN